LDTQISPSFTIKTYLKFFLKMKIIVTVLFLFAGAFARAQHPLFLPDTLSGTSFTLNVHPDSIPLKPGPFTHTLGVNANKYFGPTLFINKGDSISIRVINHIGDTTTMHWHGLHVAPQNDGGPFSTILDGASWTPSFMVRNNAAMYWYHPHMMAKTAAQAIRGDAGLIIVRDSTEASLLLPRTYGIDDFPVVVQSVELDTANQFMPRGMVDSVVLVNGTDTPFVGFPAQVVRMRLLNASGERTFNFGFTGNMPFYVIGNDAGLLRKPVRTLRVRLSPGERAEILVNLTGKLNDTLYLISYASELPIGVQGGPTMAMPPGSPAMNSPLNGIDFNILQIRVVAPTTGPITAIPTLLTNDTPYNPALANTNRYILMSADSIMVMDGPFYFNGNRYDMNRIDYRIPLHNLEIWTLKDSTMVGHPFHIHDTHFYILDRNGNPPDSTEMGRKDVLLIQPNEVVRFIAEFDDFADTTVPYMYHCHILMHEDDGMMGQFIVGANFSGVANTQLSISGLTIAPNPARNSFVVTTGGRHSSGDAHIMVFNVLGEKVYSSSYSEGVEIRTVLWKRGVYTVCVSTDAGSFRAAVLVD
jgi:blue copper oxidase